MKTRIRLLAVIFLLVSQSAIAQQWVSRYSAGSGTLNETAALDNNGDVWVVTGSSFAPDGDWDVVTIRLDQKGDTVWVRQYDDGYDEKAIDVVVDAAGYSYVLASIMDVGGNQKSVILRYNSAGKLLSETELVSAGEQDYLPVDLALLSSGNLAALLQRVTVGNAPQQESAMIVVTTPDGNPLWSDTIDDAELKALSASPDGVAAAGRKTDVSKDALVLVYSDTGSLLGTGEYNGGGGALFRFSTVFLDKFGTVYAAGEEISALGGLNPFLARFYTDGRLRWAYSRSGLPAGKHRVTGLTVKILGEAYMTIRAGNSAGDFDMLVQEVKVDGTAGWSDTYAGTGKRGDSSPPVFAGASAGSTENDETIRLYWPAASDDQSMPDEITYDVYLSDESGMQDFSTPTMTTRKTGVEISGLDMGTTYYAVVRARDMDGNRDDNTREIIVRTSGSRLSIITTDLPPVEPCRLYLALFEATGGTAPYSWTMTAGVLPDGLVFSASGRIEGETRATGSYPISVEVTDNAGARVTGDYTLVVVPARVLIVDADLTLPGGNYCFSSLHVHDGATLTFTGDTQILLSDSMVVDGVIKADCHELTFMEYAVLLVTGLIDNRCLTADSTLGGSISFFSPDGSFELTEGADGSGIYTHGALNLSDDTTFADWEFAIPPEARSVVPMDPISVVTADVLNQSLPPGEELEVEFTCEVVDPDGGPVTFDIDFGDGETRTNVETEDGESAWLLKNYDTPGLYTVTLTAKDDEGATSTSNMQLFVGDSASLGNEGLGLSIEAGDLVVPVDDTLYFDFFEGIGSDATIDSVYWNFGDGGSANVIDAVHTYTTPGRYNVTCAARDDAGNTASAAFSIYIYIPDTTAYTRTGGSSFTSSPPPPPARINAPLFVRRKIVFHGRRDMIVGPLARIFTRNGANGRNGSNGRPGAGLRTWSSGTLTINNGMFAAGNGGAGGAPAGGNSFGKRGGRGGSLIFRAKNIVVNGGTFSAGDGGPGSDVTKFKAAPGTAHAVGGAGGKAGKRVRFQASQSVSFTGPTTIHLGDGGKGGDATATGGAGQNRCKVGQPAGNGIARGGKGGKASKRGVSLGRVRGLGLITVTGGQGGKGGQGTANGGQGGSAIACESTARGGKGGYANAFGGDGGTSGYSGIRVAGARNFKPGDGGDAIANPGDGGNANAVPNPEQGADGCPGEDGGNAVATGAKGGKGYAANGRKGRKVGVGMDAQSGSATVNGSDGGGASARGGHGGNGTTCDCDGGNGGAATANGGFRGETTAVSRSGGNRIENQGTDGVAMALGGNGGNGGECCTPPAPSGGNGGNGGAATATAGPNGGGYSATGGDGGDGGDGKGPGDGGKGGTATGSGASGTTTDGTDGTDGEWCFLIQVWYIYYSTIPDGPIPGGTGFTLGTYTQKDLASQIGTLDMHFMTSLELGGMPVDYLKMGNEVIIDQGGIKMDMTSIQDVVDPSRTWTNSSITFNFHPFGTMPGVCFMGGYSGTNLIAQKEVFVDPLQPNLTGTLDAPAGQSFDTVVITTDVPITYNHWEIEGVFIDP